MFRDYHLEQDPTCLHPLAQAMTALQAVYGTIPNVYGKGKAAKQVHLNLLIRDTRLKLTPWSRARSAINSKSEIK